MAIGDFSRDDVVGNKNPLLPFVYPKVIPPVGHFDATFEGLGELLPPNPASPSVPSLSTGSSGALAWAKNNKVLIATLIVLLAALGYYFYKKRKGGKRRQNVAGVEYEFVGDKDEDEIEMKPRRTRKGKGKSKHASRRAREME